MMESFKNLLVNSTFSRIVFIFLWTVSIIVNGILLTESPLYILFILTAVFAGLGFYNWPKWFLFVLGTFISVTRIYTIPDTSDALIHISTYLIIVFISVGLMKNYQQSRNTSLELTLALANSLDTRDPYTGTHSKNVATYAHRIAEAMRLPKKCCEDIKIGGLLHDIGKIGIPEAILNKQGKLDEEEYNLIMQHPVIGYETLKHISGFKGNGVLDMIHYHHERYDGKGYPKGLEGEDIPLVARIIAVADAFDAMTSIRIYRGKLEWEEILDQMRRNKGTQFDPKVTDVFLSIVEKEGPPFVKEVRES